MLVGSGSTGFAGVPSLWFMKVQGWGPTIEVDSLHALATEFGHARTLADTLDSIVNNPLDTARAIRYAKAVGVDQLEPGLPGEPLGEWLSRVAGPKSQVEWSLTGFGRTVTVSDLTGCEDYWASVTVQVEWEHETFGVEVRIGTFKKGIFGPPVVRDCWLSNKRPGHLAVRKTRLRDLPAKLEEIRRL
jgi:hypothetical protein